MPEVIIVGAGPVGTLLAAELARRNVDVTVLERRERPGDSTRAIGVHAPVLAALEASGATERLLASAVRVSRGEARSDGRALGSVRFDRLRRRFPFVAALPQAATEQALTVGAPQPRRGVAVTSVSPEARGIRVSFGEDESMTAPIVVVAGGWRARALVYRPRGMRVRPYADRYLMADVATGRDGALAVVNIERSGVLESFPLPGGRRRFVAWDSAPDETGADARAERLRAALISCGEHEGAANVTAATPFDVRRAVAPSLRRAGLFVIGDTAHEVSPIGGQGMNLGLLDAATLAPLLARWVHTGEAPDVDLTRWEARRLASARTAAAIATINTSLGRPLPPLAHAARRAGLRLALLPPGRGCSPMRTRWGSTATPDLGSTRARRSANGTPGGHAATAPPVATSCAARSRAASMTSRNSVRLGGRTSASTAVATATTTTAPKKIHVTVDTAATSPLVDPSSTASAPKMIPPAATTAEARGPRRCGRPRTPVRWSSSRSGRTFVRCTAAPSAAPATHAHGAATRGWVAARVTSEGKIPKLTRNGTIENAVDFSAAL